MSSNGKGRLSSKESLYGGSYKESSSDQYIDKAAEIMKQGLFLWNQLTKGLPKRTTRYMAEMSR